MNNFNYITKVLINCAGADLSTMSQCTGSEVRKYTIMGTCVLIPSVMALFSGGYAMYLITQSEFAAYVFAPVWAWVIFTLDRAVVSSTRPGRISLGVFGRIFLAIVIAFTISEPVILKLFSDAIEDKRVSIIDEKQKSATLNIDNQIATLKLDKQTEKNKLDELNMSFIQEVDGTGGSRVPYRGPIAEIKWQAYQKALKDFNKNEVNREKQIDLLKTDRDQKLQLVNDKDARGFLGNIRILGRLSDEDSHVFWVTWLVRLLFLCIEIIPVLIKLGSANDFDLYNRIKDLNDSNCEILQQSLVEEKRDLMKMQQFLIMLDEKNSLQFLSTKSVMNSKTKDFEYFIDKIRYAMEQKMKVQVQIIEKIKEESPREELLAQINRVYEGYVATLEALVTKSRQYHVSIGTKNI